MGTKSNIALEDESGEIKQVCSFWDGFLSHNGRLLLENYNTTKKIEELLSHGSVILLNKTIGTKHPSTILPDNECTFYYRDGGEDYEITKPPNHRFIKISKNI